MSKNEYLEEIESTYLTIDQNFDVTFAKCANDDEKTMLVATRDAAKTALWTAVNANLQTNSTFVEKSFQDLKNANLKLKKSIQQLKDISTLINTMEEAVRLAAAVAALAA